MEMTSKIYHIYAKDKCLYHSLSEKEFKEIWEMVNNYLSITDSSQIKKEDLNYEELLTSKDMISNSSY
jgi:hypothetical protein